VIMEDFILHSIRHSSDYLLQRKCVRNAEVRILSRKSSVLSCPRSKGRSLAKYWLLRGSDVRLASQRWTSVNDELVLHGFALPSLTSTIDDPPRHLEQG
jgi:hypothetical protein